MASDVKERRGIWPATLETYSEFSDDNAMTFAASLAFYTGLAIAPLLTIAVWIARNVVGGGAADRIVSGFTEVMGPQAAESIRQLIDPASSQADQGMTISGLISIGILLFSASGVFVELQTALNWLWDVRQKPDEGVWGYVQKRVLSFGMLLALLFVLLVSGVLSAVVQALITGNGEGWWMQIVSAVVSLVLFVPLFALLFKYIPDARIGWGDVWVGATITAALFVLGKLLLGLYLGRADYGSSYGAAVGSFVVLLVWVYYSSIIVFVGAEATQVYARRQGHAVEPSQHAERIRQRVEAVPA